MNASEEAIIGLAAVQHGAFSRQQARDAGMTLPKIERRVNSGDWTRLFPGAYALAGSEPTWQQRMMGAQLAAGPNAVVSHRAAAALSGVPGVPRWPEVTTLRPGRLRVAGVIGHLTRSLPEGDVGAVLGIPVTAPVRTILDLTAVYDVKKLGPVFDYYLSRRLLKRDELEARAPALLKGRLRQLRTLAVLLDERPSTPRAVGSDFEAKLFQGLRAAGLPLPVPQYRVLMEDASEVFLDFAYPEVKLAIEADSFLWHASLGAWQRDRARNNELIAMGWSILPITYDLVVYRSAEVARQVGLALQARRAG